MLVTISIYNEFSDYMVFRGIKNVESNEFKYLDMDLDITEELVIEQLRAIHAFHEKSLGFNGYLRNRLNNNTGKVIEEYKISIKRLAGDIKNIKRDESTDPFEKLIIKYGEEVIKRGEECIRAAYQSDYIGIITRSMRRCEICLGNPGFQNLRKKDFIYVVSFEECNYNMVEIDCFIFLSKLKRKGVKLDFRKLISEFCYIEELGDSSSRFLIALISYPNEFIKYCNRYREAKKQGREDNKFPKKLIKALIQDGDSLL